MAFGNNGGTAGEASRITWNGSGSLSQYRGVIVEMLTGRFYAALILPSGVQSKWNEVQSLETGAQFLTAAAHHLEQTPHLAPSAPTYANVESFGPAPVNPPPPEPDANSSSKTEPGFWEMVKASWNEEREKQRAAKKSSTKRTAAQIDGSYGLFCPACGVSPGSRCVSDAGNSLPEPHVIRVD